MCIRLWLMVADCWVCGASLELSEEQEQQALRLLEERDKQESRDPPPAPAAPVVPVAAPVPPQAKSPGKRPAKKKPPSDRPQPRSKKPQPEKSFRAKPAAAAAIAVAPKKRRFSFLAKREPTVRRTGIAAAFKPSRVRQRLQDVNTEGEVRLWFRDVFRDLPAWLISAIVNLLLLLLLATLLMERADEEKPLEIVLSTAISEDHEPGSLEAADEPDALVFDQPGTENPTDTIAPEPSQSTDVFDKPDPPGEQLSDLPKPEPPPVTIGGGGQGGEGTHILQGRDPRARRGIALGEGGTEASEAAVALGLIWLARHQDSDGSWSLNQFNHAGDCDDRCSHKGSTRSDTAATGLALLPFLGAGETHIKGQYQNVVQTALDWLVRQQKSDGDLRGSGGGQMYAHGICAIALCEAYAMTQDPDLREPAQLAIDFIVDAQHREGGWRYRPGQAGDTSVVGWQLMALRSAQMAYLDVPDGVFERTSKYLDGVQKDRYGGQYAYMPRNSFSLAMTAEALLCRQYSGWRNDHPGLIAGCDLMLARGMPNKRTFNIYYVYYATQVMHHMQGNYFKRWNGRVRDMLIEMQETRGHQAGSWTPVRRVRGNAEGGRLFCTALSICSLEVYYRHLPLYRGEATVD